MKIAACPRSTWIFLVLSLLSLMPMVEAANKSQLSIYQHGKPVDYLPCGSSQPVARSVALMGGGLDVKAAYAWMIARMAECKDGVSGRLGNFVVIRAGGNPSYDSYIFKQGPLASVQTLVVPNPESANDPALDAVIRNAGAIFLTGGDQGDYYNFWKGSRLEKLISEQVKTYGIPIGGTSAGLMILSEFNYIAFPYTITSLEALNNPYKEGAVTLKRDFWTYRTPFLPLLSTVSDSHFDTRDRMGRLVTFMARTIGDGWVSMGNARAIGVGQETALLMTYTDQANSTSNFKLFSMQVVTNPDVNGAAYLLKPTSSSALNVQPGQPLTFTNIEVQKIQPGGASLMYRINVNGGMLSSSAGSIY